MSQEYTPVDWVDETTSQQGTLINAARLDQMQTAHHYADGFEEVDAVPTADPGVDYHKVVYCTADTTFYRWDGSQWVKDVDDTTAAELAAHEADHDNPHQVTKAQVGLGNVDNTSDYNKPVSHATAVAFGDGSVTKLGTATVGGAYTGGIYLDHGTPKACTQPVMSVNGHSGADIELDGSLIPAYHDSVTPSIAGVLGTLNTALADCVTMDNAQNIDGEKTFQGGLVVKFAPLEVIGTDISVTKDDGDHGGSITAAEITASASVATADLTASGAVTIGGTLAVTGAITGSLTGNADTATSATKVGTADLGTDTKPIKLVAGVPTAVTNDLVSTSGNQTIQGEKQFLGAYTFKRYIVTYSGATAGYRKLWTFSGRGVFNIGTHSVVGQYRALSSARYLVEFYRSTFDSTDNKQTRIYTTANTSAEEMVVGANINPAEGEGNFAIYGYMVASSSAEFLIDTAYNEDGTFKTNFAESSDTTVYSLADIGAIVPVADPYNLGAALDGYAPMVRTSGNQTILGIKLIPETVVGTKMINRVATTHALEVLSIANPTGGLTYLIHLIVSGRFDLGFMRVAVVINSDASAVTSVTTIAQGIYALSNTRQIVAGARINDGKLKLSLRAKSGNTSISAMPMNCNVDGLTQTMDLSEYGNVTAISNMTGYVEEA